MLALAGIPLGLSFRFLDPSPDAPAAEVGELLVGEYDDPELLDRLADGAAAVTYEFENVPVGAARAGRGDPRSRRARGVAGPARREAALPPARDPDAEARRRGRGVPGDPEDAPARLRRQGTASGRDMAGVRPRSCPGGTCPVRPRAVADRRSRGRRRHALLPARRERPRGRDPADVARAGGERAAGGGRGVRQERCSTRSGTSACSRSSSSTSAAACSRTSSRRASTTPATGRSRARRRASSRTTCAPSSDCRSARPRAEPSVLVNLIGAMPPTADVLADPGSASPPLREGAAAGPQARPRHARRADGDERERVAGAALVLSADARRRCCGRRTGRSARGASARARASSGRRRSSSSRSPSPGPRRLTI